MYIYTYIYICMISIKQPPFNERKNERMKEKKNERMKERMKKSKNM